MSGHEVLFLSVAVLFTANGNSNSEYNIEFGIVKLMPWLLILLGISVYGQKHKQVQGGI
jgi:hypothetical protein